ncbi:membrane fusion protein (multidrug efflux system) [Dysgonomonas hofstadii]|uniref:Membrane fusion protein (Multidrug efflux system) n=1 Tax=Dysgonomonas hofstadii TaxID=637886 RepID=A0A840CIU0_9BACT|nr:HlyD family secretion protein [Dysgonomonas hofstadii]MBB4035101.1 membrane fusion protein (multidrug efflux system) [Dysgonomonas hofstadii]
MDTDKSEAPELKQAEKEAYRKLKNKRRRNVILNSISILLALAGIIWGVNFFIHYYRYEITNDATVEQYIAPVNSRITGYIKEIRFTEHQWVNSGDTLLIIDDREFRIKEMDAEAALMDAKNSGSVLSSSITTTSTNVAVSDANVEEAKARLWRAEQDMKRYKNLLDAESVSRQQYEQVKSEYDAQSAHYNALLKQREALLSTSTETTKRQGNVEATILRREADLAMTKLNLSYTVITAPYNGYIGRRTLETGQLVQAGQTITNLIKDDNKWIIANYREKQIENISIGQEVKIRVDAISNKTFKGRVTAISEATGSKYSMLPTDNSAGNFVKIQQRIPVRIEFEDISPEDMKKLRAGMMVITEAVKD